MCICLQYKQWENEILEKDVDYDLCQIDPAPFQLVERTSLLKVITLHFFISSQSLASYFNSPFPWSKQGRDLVWTRVCMRVFQILITSGQTKMVAVLSKTSTTLHSRSICNITFVCDYCFNFCSCIHAHMYLRFSLGSQVVCIVELISCLCDLPGPSGRRCCSHRGTYCSMF